MINSLITLQMLVLLKEHGFSEVGRPQFKSQFYHFSTVWVHGSVQWFLRGDPNICLSSLQPLCCTRFHHVGTYQTIWSWTARTTCFFFLRLAMDWRPITSVDNVSRCIALMKEWADIWGNDLIWCILVVIYKGLYVSTLAIPSNAAYCCLPTYCWPEAHYRQINWFKESRQVSLNSNLFQNLKVKYNSEASEWV